MIYVSYFMRRLSHLNLVALVLYYLFVQSCLVDCKDTFTQINENIFSDIQCLPSAYADFNADKRIDIFCLSNGGKVIEIWLAQEKEPLFNKFLSLSLKSNAVIVNLVPGDFNGDSIIDLLATYKSSGDNYQMSLFLGEKSSKHTNNIFASKEIVIDHVIKDQPFVADFNGDGKFDLLIQKEDARYYLNFEESGKPFKPEKQEGSNQTIFVGYAQSITDTNNDFKPDIVLATQDANNEANIMFEVWQTNAESGAFVKTLSYRTPYDDYIYGQSLFADFDSDGSFEHLLPACKDTKCKQSAIFVYKNLEWTELPIEFGIYSFIPQVTEFWGEMKISLKAGDYNLDGFVDLLAIVKFNNDSTSWFGGSTNTETFAVLMNNIESITSNSSVSFKRTFKIEPHIISLYDHNVVQASFFDLNDDGFLDVLLAIKEEPKNNHDPTVYRVIALSNELYDDVYFLKVMVIPGRCDLSSPGLCPYQNLPYGIGYPGALIKIETTSVEYQKVQFYTTQISQTSYMALQPPYVLIGLGSTPNFIEHLNIGILSFIMTEHRVDGIVKEWTQIIPNSQLVINPNPRTTTYYWKMQLFITPSKNILMTAISLGSTMICLVIIIGVLQYKEKKVDEKERKLESQRFHFDGL